MTQSPSTTRWPSVTTMISPRCAGITLVELLLVSGLLMLIMALAVPGVKGHIESRRIAAATLQIEKIDAALVEYRDRHHRLPESLSDIDIDVPLDPWGRPYHYLAIHRGIDAPPRTDSRQVTINTDFDLYSLGPDGESATTVTAAPSRDDVIRAHDGRYIGPASQH